MFLCGNTCTGESMEPEVNIKQVPFEANLLTAINNHCKRTKKNSTVMVKKSNYDELVNECRLNGTKFTDSKFPPNDQSLNFKIEGRSITWKRLPDVVPGCIMVEDDFKPSDIQQGNIGDCYFLSSIAALAQEQQRIDRIFHGNFKINELGIYKLVVVHAGEPTQIVLDDYIPVFADTNRPVFCKATGREIWVILIEKAWAKIKGSYGDISAGCPHEVLQSFSVAPCYYYQIEDDHSEQYKATVWEELVDGAAEMMPMVAGTKEQVDLSGLLPAHAYTVLDAANIPSNGGMHRVLRLRNPWGKTQYKGYASQNDDKFWDGCKDENLKARMRPSVGVNDGDFTMPFGEFLRNFNSIDISNTIFGFSYQFQKVKMFKGEPLFHRFDITEQHEAFITVERRYASAKNDNNQQIMTTDYGFTRMLIGVQRDKDTFEYYDSKLESDFPDCTIYTKFKPGRYIMYVEIDDNRLKDQFEATLSYYFDTLETQEAKSIKVEYEEKYPRFLESVFENHARRMNIKREKIGPKPEDWAKTNFMYEQGGFGYVMVNLQHDTSIRISVSTDKKKIKENGFTLLNDHPRELTVEAGQSAIYIFSCIFDGSRTENFVFPPPGFRISRIA